VQHAVVKAQIYAIHACRTIAAIGATCSTLLYLLSGPPTLHCCTFCSLLCLAACHICCLSYLLPVISPAGEGWVSGHIVTPSQCGAGISARACHRCFVSKAPEKCLACAKSPQLKTRLLDSLSGGIYALVAADGCGACYNSAAADTCAACLYGKKPCAQCALQPENIESPAARMDVAACISCR
jgi:hypothetical protein